VRDGRVEPVAAGLDELQRVQTRALLAPAFAPSYLEIDIPGLWRDERSAQGSFSLGASPASSFYHLVGAIAELSRYKRLRLRNEGVYL
jgi:mannose-6-phosphate isomerase